jgi:hypothetical protein
MVIRPTFDVRKPYDKEANLPRWARDTIDGLRHMLADAEANLASARGEHDSSDTFVQGAGLRDASIPLGVGPTIIFRTGDCDWPVINVRRTKTGALLVMGDERLAVHPSASNSIEIVQVPR